jgi:Arc/MetJ-type ribon-helix-helix transcriptional regulator
MKLELTPETEAYIERSVREGAFKSASEFVEAAARRQMQEEAWFEKKVLEGLEGPITPLTQGDLDSVRDIARKARAAKSA